MFVNVIADSHDQFFRVMKNAGRQAILCEVAEEAFHHIQP